MHALLLFVVAAAPLVVEGEAIVTFRAGLHAHTAEQRLAKAHERLDALDEQELEAPVRRELVDAGGERAVAIFAGQQFVFTVLASDLEGVEESAFDAQVREVAQRLQRSLHIRAEKKYPHVLWRDVGGALGATAVFVLLVWLLLRLEALADRRLLDSKQLLKAGSVGVLVRRALGRVVDVVVWATVLLAGYLWLVFVLTRFGFTRELGETLGEQLSGATRRVLVGMLSALPGLAMVAVIVVLTRFLTRMVAAFLDAVERGRFQVRGLYPETLQATRRVSVIALWLFAGVVAWPYIPGSGTEAFKGLSVLVGVMLSLGATGVVNQILSGLVLVYARSLAPGDWVRVGEVEGQVQELGVLSVKLLTPNGREVTVPNAVVVASAIYNFDRGVEGKGTSVSALVTLSYDVPWQRAHELLLAAAKRVSGLTPHAFVRQRMFQDFAVEYELVAHVTPRGPVADTRSRLHGAVQDIFREAGISMVTSHQHQVQQVPAERQGTV